MGQSLSVDELLIGRIREGDEDAWSELIARYEGRLLAFAESRLRNRAAGEDAVQEVFLGFLNSLPNFDGSRSLESYLFAICAYKITDHLRREGRRPTLSLSAGRNPDDSVREPPGPGRVASSIARSGERRGLEEAALARAIYDLTERWRDKGDWVKVQCLELLFIRGWSNKKASETLELTEQQVANYKYDFLSRLRTNLSRQGLNRDIFPELAEE